MSMHGYCDKCGYIYSGINREKHECAEDEKNPSLCDICPHGSTALQCATKDGCEINNRYIALRAENERLKSILGESLSKGIISIDGVNLVEENERLRKELEDAKLKTSPVIQYGWICPRCGTVHGPYSQSCGCTAPAVTSTCTCGRIAQ